MKTGTRPDFIVIGPGKSGTTWVYNALSAHPEICVSSTKETQYFNNYFDRGEAWYLKFFSHCSEAKRIGEVSNTYIFCSETPARIRDFDASIKLISTIRNPLDRTFSHYLFLVRNGELDCSFEEALKQRPDLLERGLYSVYIKRYRQYFPAEKMLILLLDELKQDPGSYARKLYGFLEVDNTFSPSNLGEKQLGAAAPRNKFVARHMKKAALIARDLNLHQLVSRVKNSFLPGLLYRSYSEKDYPLMSESTRNDLKQYFKHDVDEMSEIVGQDLLKLWKFDA